MRLLSWRESLTCGVCAAVLAAQPAVASDHVVQIRAHVPIRCEADLTGGMAELAPGSYRLGNIRQFCNAPFSMSVLHSAIAPSATFEFKGHVAAAGGTQTLLNASSRAANDSAPIYVHGVDETEAANLSNALVLALTPLGV